MSDGDCIAREDFLQIHYERREPGHFLSGGYYKLPLELSEKITEEDIATQRSFDAEWLKKMDYQLLIKIKSLLQGL